MKVVHAFHLNTWNELLKGFLKLVEHTFYVLSIYTVIWFQNVELGILYLYSVASKIFLLYIERWIITKSYFGNSYLDRDLNDLDLT